MIVPPPPGMWRGECPKCGIDTYLRVLEEGRTRMHLHCVDCGRGHYVYAAGAKTTNPNPRRRDDIPVSEVGRLYSGGWTMERIAAHYQCGFAAVHWRVKAAGVPARPIGTAFIREAQRKSAAAKRLRGAETKRMVLACRDAGLGPLATMRKLGVCRSLVFRYLREAREAEAA